MDGHHVCVRRDLEEEALTNVMMLVDLRVVLMQLIALHWKSY